MSCMSLYLPYLAFPPPPCDTLSFVLKTPSIPLPVPHLYPTFTRFLCQPQPSNFTPFSPWPANPSFPQPRSSYPGLGSPCPCLSSSLPSPLLCLPQPQPSAQRSRGEPARNAVALDVLSKP
ncbi:hypothetical protein NQZ68_004860 [Dissostichus eleginoides]|uniref:Agglutinin receptor n=1 Tax=Dissostichus eleginoides TaxID=100907 RepID=A0AAD9FD58_DISEL|nr:hypothetical protein NQZ68_004860 [Dissostichus eleginoides]KAK1897424.1 Agglutinin receptor [Dissostichus eleginoides]